MGTKYPIIGYDDAKINKNLQIKKRNNPILPRYYQKRISHTPSNIKGTLLGLGYKNGTV